MRRKELLQKQQNEMIEEHGLIYLENVSTSCNPCVVPMGVQAVL